MAAHRAAIMPSPARLCPVQRKAAQRSGVGRGRFPLRYRRLACALPGERPLPSRRVAPRRLPLNRKPRLPRKALSARSRGLRARLHMPIHDSPCDIIKMPQGVSVFMSANSRFALGKYRAIKVVSWRVNFPSGALADFEGLLEANRKICKRCMAEKAPPDVPPN